MQRDPGSARRREGASQTSVGAMPYSARAQQLGSATEAVGYAHNAVKQRALYCTVGLQAPLGVGRTVSSNEKSSRRGYDGL